METGRNFMSTNNSEESFSVVPLISVLCQLLEPISARPELSVAKHYRRLLP
jgi:hypothetical protein